MISVGCANFRKLLKGFSRSCKTLDRVEQTIVLLVNAYKKKKNVWNLQSYLKQLKDKKYFNCIVNSCEINSYMEWKEIQDFDTKLVTIKRKN